MSLSEYAIYPVALSIGIVFKPETYTIKIHTDTYLPADMLYPCRRIREFDYRSSCSSSALHRYGEVEYRFASREDQGLPCRLRAYCADTKRLRERYFRSLMFLRDVACSIVLRRWRMCRTVDFGSHHNEFPLALGRIWLLVRSRGPFGSRSPVFGEAKVVLSSRHLQFRKTEAAKVIFENLIRELASSALSDDLFFGKVYSFNFRRYNIACRMLKTTRKRGTIETQQRLLFKIACDCQDVACSNAVTPSVLCLI